ncbi:uncharacterized protein UV8b_02512 [Ustilaginoidea virens]|uniref:Uncharacterized protein n=1 Tax=Ustilaginoidea virens TaxID=1159556 RepID=A0A8E5MFU0_USTVR|nr:uncharacterized protein UV8b_02512 [Ustilaginoidea virens]QUC18271.1 hypothetical protein UV8b_02512 [Ustilaginoidea virens]
MSRRTDSGAKVIRDPSIEQVQTLYVVSGPMLELPGKARGRHQDAEVPHDLSESDSCDPEVDSGQWTEAKMTSTSLSAKSQQLFCSQA